MWLTEISLSNDLNGVSVFIPFLKKGRLSRRPLLTIFGFAQKIHSFGQRSEDQVKMRGFLLRKEVIQPQVPLRLPCYDFIPVTTHSVGRCLLSVSARTSATSDFHDVTGGVYKARERIHGTVADVPLLAIPTSCRRVAACDPNWAQFY